MQKEVQRVISPQTLSAALCGGIAVLQPRRLLTPDTVW